MDKFDLERSPEGDRLRVHVSGADILRYPLYNKGTGFTFEERRRFGIEGLLPGQHNDIDMQSERIYRSICFNEDPVGRHIDLTLLQNRNEHLFYKVLTDHLEELMPVIYTPTVGEASRYFSRVYRRSRGLFITPDHAGRIEEVIRRSAPYEGVRLMVVTDNEAILGIGDQGAGGMAISIGKLALYSACAGIHPARTLPVSLDVGTDNEELLEDPLYLGWRQKRLRGAKYVELLDEFVQAAKKVFPDVVIQWEDLKKDNAFAMLERYRGTVPSFNDDIQGTGAVATACVQAACRIAGTPFRDSRILIFGAGAAGLGIARQLKDQLSRAGVAGEDLTRAILLMDRQGILVEERSGLDEKKRDLAWPNAMAERLALADDGRGDLESVVRAYRPTALIGTSGQAGAFDEAIVRAMDERAPTPVILPMSNPTSMSEARPADLMRWTDGRALVATGSPFDPVEVDGDRRRIGQANNVFVFPGIGLGAIVSEASEITDTMVSAGASALSKSLSDADYGERCLVPRVSRLWEVCGNVAVAVAQQAAKDGVARVADGLPERVERYRWRPRYPELVVEPD